MTPRLLPQQSPGSMDEPGTAAQLALLGMRRAEERFGLQRYSEGIAAVVSDVVKRPAPAPVADRAKVVQT